MTLWVVYKEAPTPPPPLYSTVGFTRETDQWHELPTLLPKDNQRLLFLAWTFTNFRLIISSGADFANFAVMFWTLSKWRHPLSTMPCLWMRTSGQFLGTVVLAYRNIFIFDKTFPPQLLSLRRNRYIPSWFLTFNENSSLFHFVFYLI